MCDPIRPPGVGSGTPPYSGNYTPYDSAYILSSAYLLLYFLHILCFPNLHTKDIYLFLLKVTFLTFCEELRRRMEIKGIFAYALCLNTVLKDDRFLYLDTYRNLLWTLVCCSTLAQQSPPGGRSCIQRTSGGWSREAGGPLCTPNTHQHCLLRATTGKHGTVLVAGGLSLL